MDAPRKPRRRHIDAGADEHRAPRGGRDGEPDPGVEPLGRACAIVQPERAARYDRALMPRHRTKRRVIDMSVPPDDRAERAAGKRLKKKCGGWRSAQGGKWETLNVEDGASLFSSDFLSTSRRRWKDREPNRAGTVQKQGAQCICGA